MIGAKVNNRIASYDQVLHNGDIVEVLTSKSAKGPSRDWLNICRSNQARIKIKQWFKREKRDENIIRGKASLNPSCAASASTPRSFSPRKCCRWFSSGSASTVWTICMLPSASAV